MSDAQEWYKNDYLTTAHWQAIRKRIYKRFPYCQICGKKYHLEAHHLSYARRGTKNEHKDVRMLCHSCHRRQHFIFWFFKMPLSSSWLIFRYYQTKLDHKIMPNRYPVIILAIIIFLLQLAYIYAMNDLSTDSKGYQQMQDEIQGIRKENILLKEQLLINQSLTVIFEKAIKMGFKEGKAIYLLQSE